MRITRPEVAILVSSFERPGHLRRVLASVAAQRGVKGAMEVVITDDGSQDETLRLIREFAASANFPVHFTTHPHGGFHIARCRNEGVAASTAPYLLFLDGDCIIPADHVRTHLDRRRSGCALAGYPIYLSRAAAEKITEDDISIGQYERHVSVWQRLEMRWRHLRNEFYSLIRDPQRPKLLGGNLGISRADYERVNGYDENFQGWGCEDDDLGLRLRASGVSVASIAWWTNTFHLWHPKTPTAPETWRGGANVDYFRRPLRLTQCLAGLVKRRLQDLRIGIAGPHPDRKILDRTLPLWCRVAIASSATDTEIEIAFAGEQGTFSSRCACRILIVPPGTAPSRSQARQAGVIFADRQFAGADPRFTFPYHCFDTVIQQQLGFRPPVRQEMLRNAAA
jgi:glycosyltransferase involved in cell wall biosynthesis